MTLHDLVKDFSHVDIIIKENDNFEITIHKTHSHSIIVKTYYDNKIYYTIEKDGESITSGEIPCASDHKEQLACEIAYALAKGKIIQIYI